MSANSTPFSIRRIKPKQLSPWAEQPKARWKEHRPNMYAELERAGTLDQAAESAAKQTEDELYSAIEKGADYQSAWEAVRENHLFLPAEEDVPLLGENPNGTESSY